ncbi:hypothetical protein EaACW_1729 [Erwinia amylovora ACW56400]|uniref:Uncharacterized protein n=2 Tax=Erwinia amylovora TaxID=552 RepID=A0A831A176_ERWAM|nr:hypothetical protein EaACW_1729 [Erwinia amylovora ACW56400]CBA20674.1 hypothetical protein predicted by Glimmer/Critica [Erwinia amylovora CFBP1430]CCO78577.1 hypothetical protein BN432_1779 [Erwinia amylovora Ea356]CCO82372.1 hypothetical protein BN433_1802 [Erwinia amylovora Ea266]CCO86158.1 hypothetical protein BN434_1770 [Erwinia amylovora CFBP 2585]CCO89946.1 hypothetical protein BN435_1775 [Erwinia amylovora 01SFR-BO]CCO93704.1 hypothetical protein BN437_1774 [Erwinia amylovora NBRC
MMIYSHVCSLSSQPDRPATNKKQVAQWQHTG